MRLIMVAISLYMIWADRAQAQTSLTKAVAVDAAKKKFSLSTSIAVDSNLRATSQADYSANLFLSLIPAYQISQLLNLSARLDLEQKLYANDQTALSDMLINIRREALPINLNLDFIPQIFAVLPTNETNRNENSFQGGAGFAGGIKYKKTLYNKAGSIDASFSALKNLHEFERTNLLEANLSHRLRYTLTVIQEFSKKLSAEIIARYQTGWTYQNALRTSFLLTETIRLSIDESSSVYISHTNSGDALRPNGIDSNIRLYNAADSTWSTGIDIQF